MQTVVCALVLIAISFASAVHGQIKTPPPTAVVLVSHVDALVQAEMLRQKVPGMAVAVILRGEVLVAKGYGLANVEHDVPVTAETLFQSASVGKQFTAAAVMALVEDGKLSLDDPVSKYLPDVPRTWQSITVRHLLTHTSGIPDYDEPVVDYRKDYTDAELAKIAYSLPLEFPPGSRWNYSNTGYLLLGQIVQNASGHSLGDIYRDRIFGPAGMKTARVISEEDIVPHRAAGYRLVQGTLKNQVWVAPKFNTTADGCIYFSILDLVAWDRALRAKAILRPESWAQVFTPVRLTSGKTYPYGFGWVIDMVAGQTVQKHSGVWQGFRTIIVRYTGDDLTIVVLANLAQADPVRFADAIATAINPELLGGAEFLVYRRLAVGSLIPIPDRELAVRARIKAFLAATAAGQLKPEEFGYVGAGFFPGVADGYRKRLEACGPLHEAVLVGRCELGDDVIYCYSANYEGKSFTVFLGLAPDGKVSIFKITERQSAPVPPAYDPIKPGETKASSK